MSFGNSNSNPVGGALNGVIGLAVGAGVLYYLVIPAVVGCGTQRYADQGDVDKPGTFARWFGANVCRVGGEFNVAFPQVAGGSNGAVAGTGGYKGKVELPQGQTGWRLFSPDGNYALPQSAPAPIAPPVTAPTTSAPPQIPAFQQSGAIGSQSMEIDQKKYYDGEFLTFEEIARREQRNKGVGR